MLVAGASPAPPRRLRTDGLDRNIGVGTDPPLFSWEPDRRQRSAQVVVTAENDAVIWDSGTIVTTAPELRFAGPALRSRGRYRWRARIADEHGRWSAWGEATSFETALLGPGDWGARWISRAVPASSRVIRSVDSDDVAWVDGAGWLGQAFTATGPVHAVSVDITKEPDGHVDGRLELCDAAGTAVAARPLGAVDMAQWDRFSHFLEVNPPAPPGEYVVRVTVRRGRIGWRGLARAKPIPPEDGVSPLPVRGRALRDGHEEPGVRTLGVETAPPANPIFRAAFDVPSGATDARLYAVGLGYGSFSINDQPVAEDVLDPPPTAYDHTILYRTYDVTDLLRPGHNTITAALGRGFYAARGASTWAWHLAPWHREPALIAQLEYRDAEGRSHTVVSGAEWETAAGVVVTDLLYCGEWHESRAPGAVSWTPVTVVTSPAGLLRPATLPPVRRFTPRPAVTSWQLGQATTVHDFGAIIAGRIRCAVSGPAGASLTVRYGEHLTADGAVVCQNALAAGDAQVDNYTIGTPETSVTWEPWFTYKGFRYASIETTGEVTVGDVVAIPLHTEVARVGELACADETLTWIDQATARTFLNNLHGIPTDTPIYEKNGWTADAHLAAESVLHHFDLRSTLGKWLDDHVDAQAADGVVPQIVPTPGWGRAADPAWSASMVLIPWDLYWEYGDPSILERYLTPIRRYTDRLLEISGQGLWSHRSWGDWLAPGDPSTHEGPVPTATMMLHHVATRTARICRELALTSAATHYAGAARTIADAYHREFFDPSTGSYRAPGASYRQTMNILPLAFDAVPDQHVDAVAKSLFNDIEQRTDGHLDCGAIGVKYLLPVLTDHGRAGLAVTVATRQTRPGWGVWKATGAQTLFEAWDESARSRSHYFLGSAAAWIQQRVAGLRATSPGWKSFELRPVVDDRIGWARIAHDTARGRVAVRWRRSGDRIDGTVTVPAGATARIAGTSLGSGFHDFSVPTDRFVASRPDGGIQ